MDDRHPDTPLAVDRLRPGLEVYTADGRRLGRVKAASERCVQIDARFAFDYWISRRAVATVNGGRLLLGIAKAQVGTYLVDPDCIEDDHLRPAGRVRLSQLPAAA